jgi:hypothetical protein
MKWYKYREKWSHGHGDWQYMAIEDDERPKDCLDPILDDYSWSEHFRGIEYYRMKYVPRVIIQKKIENAKRSIKCKRQQIKDLQAHAKELESQLKELPEADGEAKITVHTLAGQGVYEIWAVVTVNKKSVYKSRKGKNRDKIRDRARNWCKKNNLDIVDEKYNMEVVPR